MSKVDPPNSLTDLWGPLTTDVHRFRGIATTIDLRNVMPRVLTRLLRLQVDQRRVSDTRDFIRAKRWGAEMPRIRLLRRFPQHRSHHSLNSDEWS